MSEETKQIMQSNPQMTYAQSAGYAIGRTAKAMGQQFAGLSKEEWANATDEYAHGYRLAFKAEKAKL